MKRQNVRVIVASEYPEVQHLLRGVAEEEGRAVTVGQAQDASTALTLARNLRPDVAIIDSCLPHVVGRDTIPLSRIGGLDIAQTISEQIPNIRVILVNNLDARILPDRSLSSDVSAIYSIESRGANIPFVLQGLSHEVVQPNALVFARVEVKQQAALRQKVTSLSDKAILFGGLGIVGGWFLTITTIFAPAGVFLSLAGAVTLFLGLAGKLTLSWWRRLRRKGAKL